MVEVRKAYFLAIKKGNSFPDYYKKNPKANRDDYPCDLFPHIFLGTKLAQNPYTTLIQPASSRIDSG